MKKYYIISLSMSVCVCMCACARIKGLHISTGCCCRSALIRTNGRHKHASTHKQHTTILTFSRNIHLFTCLIFRKSCISIYYNKYVSNVLVACLRLIYI